MVVRTDVATLHRCAGRRWDAIAKRFLDITAACVLIVLLSPVLLIAAVVVRVTSPGPALFRQTRVGRFGLPFTMFKFRTMYVGCPDDIHRAYVGRLLKDDAATETAARPVYKLHDDPRVTRVGKLLRKTSVDELPQLLNVVRGEMSLVGPRPALPWEAELFGPEHQERLMVPPGLTGLWQVSGRNHLTMRHGLDLDLVYVQQRSFLLDVKILLRTIPVVVLGRGAR